MKIYTKTGDDGTTGLQEFSRVYKDDRQIQCLGDIDELNSELAVVLAFSSEEIPFIGKIQTNLFLIGAYLSKVDPTGCQMHEITKSENDGIIGMITDIETEIDRMAALLPELTNFVLPGGAISATCAYHARAVCRRAERSLIHFLRERSAIQINSPIARYINRISDYLFTLFRFINHQAGIKDKLVWPEKADQ